MMVGRAVLLAALMPVPVAAQWLSYDGGLSVATGSYIFTTRTTSWTLFTGLSAQAGRFTLHTTLPLFAQNTTLVTGSGAGMIPSGGPASGMVRDSAGHGGMMGGGGSSGRPRLQPPASSVTGYQVVLGDPVVRLAWQAIDGAMAVTASASAKLPVTDTSAFGTGAWDVGGTLSLTRQLGAGFVGLDLGYWQLGDLPTLDFANPLMGTLSGGRAISGRWAVSLFASGSTPWLRGYDAPAAVGATVARLGTRAPWALTASFGLTETSPDVAVILDWRVVLH